MDTLNTYWKPILIGLSTLLIIALILSFRGISQPKAISYEATQVSTGESDVQGI